MGVKISMAALFVVLAATMLQTGYCATYTVGDSTGWGIPTNNADFYDNWADNKNFVVGDVLVFNFTTAHNVAEVTEAAYDSCNTANTISTVSNGPARITLNRTGEHYFICSVPGHCSAGQKLNVEVRNGNHTTTVPTPRPSPTMPPSAITPSGTPSPTMPPSAITPAGTPSPTTPAGTASSPSPGTGSPPRDSSASSFVASMSPVFFMSIALALLY